jgi:hypothetical protein
MDLTDSNRPNSGRALKFFVYVAVSLKQSGSFLHEKREAKPPLSAQVITQY